MSATCRYSPVTVSPSSASSFISCLKVYCSRTRFQSFSFAVKRVMICAGVNTLGGDLSSSPSCAWVGSSRKTSTAKSKIIGAARRWRFTAMAAQCSEFTGACQPNCGIGTMVRPLLDKVVATNMGAVEKSRTHETPKAQVVTAAPLTAFSWLIHGFSTRQGGRSDVYGGRSLNLGFTKQDSHSVVEQNRRTFLRGLGASKNARLWPLVTQRQVHSDLIHCVDSVPEHPLTGDGLLTRTPGIVLGILTADCLPVILVDSKRRAVGIFHAGWRGTVKRIVEKGVGEMQRYFGTDPRNMIAVIGPGVQSCCYQVGEEVRQKFEAQFAYAAELFRQVKESDPVREKYPMLFLTARAPGHSELPVNLFLNLVEANRRQLIDAGVPAKNIDASSPCTACHTDLLFSHRAEKGITGRLMAVVG